MTKNREDRRRKRKEHRSTSSTKEMQPQDAQAHGNSSGRLSTQSRRSDAFELNSIADAKMKLHENRIRILKDMGIADKADNQSVISKSSNAEVVRETVIEHKIQIPRKSTVTRDIMRVESYDDVEMVSEDVIEMERHAEHVVTVNRPSVMLEPRYVDEIVDVPEVIVRKNFIEKKVPMVIQRVKEVADEEVQFVEMQVPVSEIEYRDEVVQLEEEYIQYVDVHVNEYVEVPNYVEIAEEKHVVRDDVTDVNHFEPQAVELEHMINYECPMLKPIYTDEFYDINIPRIIQVPVYEDLLPPGNLETLYILKDRFDEMKTMQEPMSMRFAEDYAVHALNTFYADDRVVRLDSLEKLKGENIRAPSVEPDMEIPLGAPLHNRTVPVKQQQPRQPQQQQQQRTVSQISVGQHIQHPHSQAYHQQYVRSQDHSNAVSGNKSYASNKSYEQSPSYQTSAKTPAAKQSKGCCAAPISGVTPRPHPSKKEKKSSKSSKPRANTNTASQMTGPHNSPSFSNINFPNHVNYQTRPYTTGSAASPPSQITAPPTFGESMHQEMIMTMSGDLTPKITETFIGQRVEKRSVDTNYVQQFVTNADPHNRHPPSAIAAVPKATTFARVNETDSVSQTAAYPYDSVTGPYDSNTAPYEPSLIASNIHYVDARTSADSVIFNLPGKMSPDEMSLPMTSDRSVYSAAKEGTLSVTESLYNEGAASRSAGLPRVDRNGGVLIHPPVPRKA